MGVHACVCVFSDTLALVRNSPRPGFVEVSLRHARVECAVSLWGAFVRSCLQHLLMHSSPHELWWRCPVSPCRRWPWSLVVSAPREVCWDGRCLATLLSDGGRRTRVQGSHVTASVVRTECCRVSKLYDCHLSV